MFAVTAPAVTPPGVIFYSSDPTGIPDLIPEIQATGIVTPVQGWGMVGRALKHRGTWHCYVEDRRFSNLWTRPERLVETEAAAAVEINFSIGSDDPVALALWTIFRKRWVSRYWQGCGLPVLVDLFVPSLFAELNLIGVPHGWRAWATRANASWEGELDEQYEVAVKRGGGAPRVFLVVGTGAKLEAWCREHEGAIFHDRLAGRKVQQDGEKVRRKEAEE